MTEASGDQNPAGDSAAQAPANEAADSAETAETAEPELSAEEQARLRVLELEEEVAGLKDKWLRAVAENDNYRKRVKRDIDDAVFRSKKSVITDFLPVFDNLDRALSMSKERDDIAKGIEMVLSEFNRALGKHNITQVPGVGHPFDPAIHEALQQIASPDHPPGTVAMVYESGFKLGERLLRAARVIVAGPDSTGKAPAEDGAQGEAEAAN